MPTLSNDQHYTFTASGVGQIDLTLTGGAMASVSIVRNGESQSQKYYDTGSVFGFYAGDRVTVVAENGTIQYTVTQFDNLAVVASAAPVDADGRPNGTIYIQTA